MKCEKTNPLQSMVTISCRGQIVVPASIMRELGLKAGDQLFIVKREDNLGFTALTGEAISKSLKKIIDKT